MLCGDKKVDGRYGSYLQSVIMQVDNMLLSPPTFIASEFSVQWPYQTALSLSLFSWCKQLSSLDTKHAVL